MRNADPDQFDDAGIVTLEEFPWGLRCPLCDQVIDNGEAYCSVPDDTTRNGDVVGLVVCTGCAVTARL